MSRMNPLIAESLRMRNYICFFMIVVVSSEVRFVAGLGRDLLLVGRGFFLMRGQRIESTVVGLTCHS